MNYFLLWYIFKFLYKDNEVKYEIVCKSCHTKREFKSDNPDYCLFTEKAALTPDIYEKYLEELSKENKKEKKSKK